MVVVFIVGILATVISLSIGNRALDDRLEAESERVEQLFKLAQEESQLKGIALGLRFTAGGFEFLELDDKNHWVDYAQSGVLRPRKLTQPFYAELHVEGRMVPPAPDPPQTQAPADDEALKKIKPHVLLLPGGESTAFSVDLLAPAYPIYYHIEGDALGRIVRERRSLGR